MAVIITNHRREIGSLALFFLSQRKPFACDSVKSHGFKMPFKTQSKLNYIYITKIYAN